MSELTAERARQLFVYDEATGELIWRARPVSDFVSESAQKIWNKRFAGKVAGTTLNTGYRAVSVDWRKYLLHRVIWLIVHGEWPKGTIDHEFGDRAANQTEHLRDIPKAEQCLNSAMRHDNTSGVTGVSWNRAKGKFAAYVNRDGVRKRLGYFDDIASAAAARKVAERAAGFHPNHGRKQA